MNLPYLLPAIMGCLIVVLYIRQRNKTRRSKQLQQLRHHWGKPVDTTRDFNWIGYYNKFTRTTNSISNQTILDLDLQDLFHYLDRTHSKPGQQYLYHLLTHPTADITELQWFDELCEHFSQAHGSREKIQLLLARLNQQEAYYIASLLEEDLFPEPAWSRWLVLDQFLVIALLAGSIWMPALLVWSMAPFTLNMLLHLWSKFKAGRFMQALPQLRLLIDVARQLEEAGLPVQHWPIHTELHALQRFKQRFSLFSSTYTGNDVSAVLFFAVEAVKALFLVDIRAFLGCMRLIKQNKAAISQLIAYTGRIDAAVSIASVRMGSRQWCKPYFVPGEKRMIARDVYHPLVKDCVRNSIEINGSSVLVTGSNMSGKTTFIRTMAINSLLAQTFYTCFARYYQLPFMQLHTSIRVSDDLLQGKSYFLEEIAIIREFVGKANDDAQHLFVLDEVFKGTNTEERIAAGKAVLRYLNRHNNIVLVSTHDTALAPLLHTEFDLYHFEESITDGSLVFDHILKPGILTRHNAIRLLEISGYPEALIRDAQETIQLKS